jgi:hypothetical protein
MCSVNHRLAGRKQEARAKADASHSSSVEYTVFMKKIACLAFTRQVVGH